MKLMAMYIPIMLAFVVFAFFGHWIPLLYALTTLSIFGQITQIHILIVRHKRF